MEMQGYNRGLAFIEVTGFDDEGNFLNVMRARVPKNNGTGWVTVRECMKAMERDLAATKFKRKNVWKYEIYEE